MGGIDNSRQVSPQSICTVNEVYTWLLHDGCNPSQMVPQIKKQLKIHPCLPRRSHAYNKYSVHSRLDDGRAALAVTPRVTKATIKDPNRTILDTLCVLIEVLLYQGLRVKNRETTRSRNTASNTRYILGISVKTNVSWVFETNNRWHK